MLAGSVISRSWITLITQSSSRISSTSMTVGILEQNIVYFSSKTPSTTTGTGESSTTTTTNMSDKEKSRKKLVQKLDFKFGSGKDKKKQDASAAASNGAKEVPIPDDLLAAVKSVAQNLGGDSKATESELLQKLKDQAAAPTKIDLSQVFVGMKIDGTKTKKPEKEGFIPKMTDMAGGGGSRAQRVRGILEEQDRHRQQRKRSISEDLREQYGVGGKDQGRGQFRQPREARPPGGPSYVKVDLFGGRPLGIFTSSKLKPDEFTDKEVPKLKTWDALYEKELKLSVTHPPRNGFEEMILWTEQGKLWKFPVDNEQGTDEEAKISFHEHVFLEPVINSWCPKKGPIRHFMELVCVALGKNPHMTVTQKHEYIEWYHQYFANKASLLKDLGAGDVK